CYISDHYIPTFRLSGDPLTLYLSYIIFTQLYVLYFLFYIFDLYFSTSVFFTVFFYFFFFFFFSSRRRHTRCYRDWSSDVCSSDLAVRHAELHRVCRCW